jgi:hypothetical protein
MAQYLWRRNILKALRYTFKCTCIETVSAKDRTWVTIAGAPTRRSDHYAKFPVDYNENLSTTNVHFRNFQQVSDCEDK